MSYQVLARKWRPRFFDEMVGQEHVLRALINALNEERLHHAYLFTGTRGVGKTTIARILAKCLNCEEGVSARPCGTCSSCQEIADGRFVDLIEVDAASRTKVEDTRELLDNVQYAPTRGRFKVYLIDEVHMLSTHSFNALLKTLEEPPAHVKFLLATTDPQKLPVTILSRCLQFSLKNMTPEKIVSYLAQVLDAEKLSYEEPALWQLGRAAQGSMRDALSLTDQAIAYGEGQVGEEQVNAMLGTMDRGRLFKLAEVMARANAAEVLTEVAAMAEHGPDYDEVLQGLLAIWHRASLAQVVPDAIENTQGDRDAILKLSVNMQPEDLQLYYQIALQGRGDLSLAPDPRQGFEMILLRMLAFRPAPQAPVDLDLESALSAAPAINAEPVVSAEPGPEKKKPLTVESTLESGPETEPDIAPVSEAAVPETAVSEPEPMPVSRPEPAIEQPVAELSAAELSTAELSTSEQSAVAVQNPVVEAAKPAALSIEERLQQAQHDAPVEVESPPAPSVKDVAPAEPDQPLEPLQPHNWWQWADRLALAGLPQAIARNSALIDVTGEHYTFDVDPAQGALFNDTQAKRIEAALQQLIPGSSLSMVLQPPRGETPEQRRQREKAEAFYAAKQSIDSDPVVNHILTEMGGYVVEETIRPLS
ncbi:DNA polymerase III subunit gamma/tau [Bacterioplanoides sp.]|uniref:DNA polymerase III subunit gamma/tau n=1 Tax=Bacterioplanoides sp. TaxID=2066072 RepID=UPI003AFFBCC2